MGDKRRNLWALLLIAVIVIAVALVLYVVGRSPQQRRNDLGTYLGLAAGLIALAAPAIIRLWRQRKKQVGGTPDLPDLDRLADQLAEEVRRQWENAASQRKLQPKPIPVRWQLLSAPLAEHAAPAIESRRFQPLPGLDPVDEQIPQGGGMRDLHAVYGGLGSGRLVIAGAPGSGKSGAAVLLVLAALRHRQSVDKEARPKVPVPVMFTLQGWDPNRTTFEKWLIGRLRQTYGLLAGKDGEAKAARLLAAADKVAVILDGLDEIPAELRPVALQALSEQAGCRVVLLTRTTEMIDAAKQQMLHGAVSIELRDVDPETAASYLTSVRSVAPSDSWRELTQRIRHEPGSPLARALSSPLALTLVRDTYRNEDDVRELLAISQAADGNVTDQERVERIVDHLLDRVVPAAYARRPGRPLKYDLHTAQKNLRRIADGMGRRRSLEWWENAQLMPVAPRIVPGLVLGLMFGLVALLVAGLIGGLTAGLTALLVAGPTTGLLSGLAFGYGASYNLNLSWWWRHTWAGRNFSPGWLAPLPIVAAGFGVALWGWLAGWLLFGVVFGLLAGLGAGLGPGIVQGPSRWTPWIKAPRPGWDVVEAWTGQAASQADHQRPEGQVLALEDAQIIDPRAEWRRERRSTAAVWFVSALVPALAVGLMAWLAAWLTAWLFAGPGSGAWLRVGLGVGLGVMLGLISGPLRRGVLGPYGDANQKFALLWLSPVRLLRFLEDARERDVLRTVGLIYQFRHARLQDRLAEQATASTSTQDPSRATAV